MTDSRRYDTRANERPRKYSGVEVKMARRFHRFLR